MLDDPVVAGKYVVEGLGEVVFGWGAVVELDDGQPGQLC